MQELLQLWENGQLNLNEVRQAFQMPPDPQYGPLTYSELFLSKRQGTKALRLKSVPEDYAFVDRMEAKRQQIEKQLHRLMLNWLRSIHQQLLSAFHRKSFEDMNAAITALFDTKLAFGKVIDQKYKEIALNAVKSGGEQAAHDVGGTFDSLDDEIYDVLVQMKQEFLDGQQDKYERVIGKIYEDARTADHILSTAELEKRFKRKFDEYERNASKQIAITESVRLMMAGAMIGYKQNGIQRIYWHAERDACPFCQKLHGHVIHIGEMFYRAGDTIKTADSNGEVQEMRVSMDIPYPPAHPNCRCSIVPIQEEEIFDVEIIEEIEDDDIDFDEDEMLDLIDDELDDPPETIFDEETRSTLIPYRPNILISKSLEEQIETTRYFSHLLDEHDRKESDRDTKIRITRNLYTWMKADPHRYALHEMEQLGKFFENVGEFRHSSDHPRIDYHRIYDTWAERAIARAGRQWAINSRFGALAVTLQRAAKLEFHLTSARVDHFESDYIDVAEKRGYFQHLAAFRGLLRAQYDFTQAWLKQNFVEDTIPLFRGMGFADPITENDHYDIRRLHIQKRQLQPLNSFSTSPEMALIFANYQSEYPYRAVMGARIPRERILSTSQTGFGCKEETEMVVLGSLEKEDDWWQFHFHRDDRKRIETDQMYGMWEKAKEMINGENDDKIERKEMMSMAETFDWRKEMELHVGTPYIRDPLIGEHQKRKWTIDPYKSPAFLDMLRVNGMTLDDFRKTDLYGSAVQDGLIVNDEWVGPNDIGGW